MKKRLKQHRLSFDALTLANLVIGAILTINPKFSTTVICIILSVACLIWSGKSLFSYFKKKKNGFVSHFDLLSACAGLAAGIFFLTGIQIVVSLLPLIIGMTVSVQSVSKIRFALYQKKTGTRKWLLPLILNIFGLLLGILLVCNPFKTMMNILRLLGIVLFINGISRIFTDFLFAGEMEKSQKDDIIDVSFSELNNYIEEK